MRPDSADEFEEGMWPGDHPDLEPFVERAMDLQDPEDLDNPENLEGIVEVWQRAVATLPHLSGSHLMLADALNDQGKSSEGARVLQKAIDAGHSELLPHLIEMFPLAVHADDLARAGRDPELSVEAFIALSARDEPILAVAVHPNIGEDSKANPHYRDACVNVAATLVRRGDVGQARSFLTALGNFPATAELRDLTVVEELSHAGSWLPLPLRNALLPPTADWDGEAFSELHAAQRRKVLAQLKKHCPATASRHWRRLKRWHVRVSNREKMKLLPVWVMLVLVLAVLLRSLIGS